MKQEDFNNDQNLNKNYSQKNNLLNLHIQNQRWRDMRKTEHNRENHFLNEM